MRDGVVREEANEVRGKVTEIGQPQGGSVHSSIPADPFQQIHSCMSTHSQPLQITETQIHGERQQNAQPTSH